MKKTLLALLVLPLFLVACSEKGDDPNLQGTWMGEVKVSDLETLNLISKDALAANERLATETLVFKFDDRKIEIYRTKNADSMSNKVEVEKGDYTAEEGTLDISITSLSCATNDGKNFGKNLELKKEVTYSLSEEDLNQMTLNFGINKKVLLTKQEGSDEVAIENAIESSNIGCFKSDGKFEKNPIQKPKQAVDLLGQLEAKDQE